MRYCKDCWNFDRCNVERKTVKFAVDDGVCLNFDGKPMTNADRIRAMDDELLATQLTQVFREGVQAIAGGLDVPDEILDEIRSDILKKLQQTAEGE